MIVTCKFAGRLCNNILQVMTMIGYSKTYNVPWFIPRQYHHKDIFRLGLPLMRGPKRYNEYHDPWSETIGYKEIPFHPNGVTLTGFFQSEKYFAHAKDEINKAFGILNGRAMIADNFSSTCSIHIRRGDYLEYPTRFCTPSVEYIMNAVEVIKSKGCHNFKIYTDDKEWCKQNFPFEVSTHTDPIDDIMEMAHCEHNIICASTFGWVPAWLNKNPDKVVVAPKVWFGPDTKLTDKDVIPETWMRI